MSAGMQVVLGVEPKLLHVRRMHSLLLSYTSSKSKCLIPKETCTALNECIQFTSTSELGVGGTDGETAQGLKYALLLQRTEIWFTIHNSNRRGLDTILCVIRHQAHVRGVHTYMRQTHILKKPHVSLL